MGDLDEKADTELGLHYLLNEFPGFADARILSIRVMRGEWPAQRSCAGFDLPPPVQGGASRQLSVLNGLEALANTPPEFVAIHDGARPFVRPDDIAGCLDAAAAAGIDGAILGIALADTLKAAPAPKKRTFTSSIFLPVRVHG